MCIRDRFVCVCVCVCMCAVLTPAISTKTVENIAFRSWHRCNEACYLQVYSLCEKASLINAQENPWLYSIEYLNCPCTDHIDFAYFFKIFARNLPWTAQVNHMGGSLIDDSAMKNQSMLFTFCRRARDFYAMPCFARSFHSMPEICHDNLLECVDSHGRLFWSTAERKK